MAWIEKKRNKAGKVTGCIIRYWKAGRGSEKGWSEVYETKGKASEALPAWQAIEDAGKELGLRQHASIHLKELIIRYLDYRISKKKIDASYRAERLKELNAIIDDCNWTKTEDVSSAGVIAWHTRHGGKGSRKGGYLRAVLIWSRNNFHQQVDPVALELLKVTKSTRKVIERPSALEVATWLASGKRYGENAFALLYHLRWYGWRPVTAAKMVIGDLALNETKIILRGLKRGGGDIEHPITEESAELLRKITKGRPPTDPVFLDPTTGKRWALRGGIKNWWRKFIDSRPKKGIYNLKYEAISHMFACGLPPADIQNFTGHRDINQVMVYARTNDASRRVSLELFTAHKELPRRARVGHQEQPPPILSSPQLSQLIATKRSATS